MIHFGDLLGVCELDSGLIVWMMCSESFLLAMVKLSRALQDLKGSPLMLGALFSTACPGRDRILLSLRLSNRLDHSSLVP